jgi:hypothetical protein
VGSRNAVSALEYRHGANISQKGCKQNWNCVLLALEEERKKRKIKEIAGLM